MFKALAGAGALFACGSPPAALDSAAANPAARDRAAAPVSASAGPLVQPLTAEPARDRSPAAPRCAPADCSAASLSALLEPGNTSSPSQPDRVGAEQRLFAEECTAGPARPPLQATEPALVDGVEIRLVSATLAGTSGRGWLG